MHRLILLRRGRHLAARLPLVLAVCLCAMRLYLCHRAIRVMERAVTVMENVDTKLDRAIAGAPSAVDRGKALLSSPEAASIRDAAKKWIGSQPNDANP